MSDKTTEELALEPEDSPCQLVCSMERESGHCFGCGRTQDEISYWTMKTPEERQTILAELPAKKRYNISGTWNVSEKDGQKTISFSDDFKTKGGPDLKVYLSSKTISELESGSVESSSKKISILKSNQGAQSYIIPADVNLSEYKSVVIHCEAFSVLWGGFDIAKTP